MTSGRLTASLRPFQQFVQTEAAGGAILLLCAVAALVLANSPWADSFEHVWEKPVGVLVFDRSFSLTLHEWINDGLMSIFFLLVGLEIKRELLVGELASVRQAALPIAGALGGMALPSLLYAAVAQEGRALRGWGIPMATDIAFALGALSLVAPNAPNGLRVFLAALAIVDDMGAVAIIAFFYTSTLALAPLLMAGLVLAALVALNVLRVWRLAPYLLLGCPLWFFIHESGVHATVAGVLLALAIPTRARINAKQFSEEARTLLDEFDRTETGDYLVLTSKGQQEAIGDLERATDAVMAPALQLKQALHLTSAFVVMPLFALSNAGVPVATANVGERIALAVAVGLVLGKPLGITAAAFAAVRLKLAHLPRGVNWAALHGCAWLGGIGFTMSLFIATLAFKDAALLASAKVGIIVGSSVAAAVGAVMLRRAT